MKPGDPSSSLLPPINNTDDSLKDFEHSPHTEKRGIKFNIPVKRSWMTLFAFLGATWCGLD